jgi:hypothetical protein
VVARQATNVDGDLEGDAHGESNCGGRDGLRSFLLHTPDPYFTAWIGPDSLVK